MNNNIHSASSASEAVKSWWRGVEEWWNPPWFTEDDGLCIIGLIFYLLLVAVFVVLCWFAYKWYKNRQSMNNAIQNLENTDEDSSGNEETLNGPDSITVTSRIVTYADSSESSDSD